MNTFRSVTHTLIAAAWATGLATSAHAQSTRELDAALGHGLHSLIRERPEHNIGGRIDLRRC